MKWGMIEWTYKIWTVSLTFDLGTAIFRIAMSNTLGVFDKLASLLSRRLKSAKGPTNWYWWLILFDCWNKLFKNDLTTFSELERNCRRVSVCLTKEYIARSNVGDVYLKVIIIFQAFRAISALFSAKNDAQLRNLHLVSEK